MPKQQKQQNIKKREKKKKQTKQSIQYNNYSKSKITQHVPLENWCILQDKTVYSHCLKKQIILTRYKKSFFKLNKSTNMILNIYFSSCLYFYVLLLCCFIPFVQC